MRIDDSIRKMVVFVGLESDDAPFLPLGTALVGGCEVGKRRATLLVTAKHVFDSLPDPFSVRLNRKSGEAEIIKVKKNGYPHKDPHNDLVLVPFRANFNTQDVMAERLDRAHHERELQQLWSPGIGDEVSIVG